MGKMILVTGGARSGKSAYAEKMAGSFGKNITYIATAQAFDDEMKNRIRQHKKRRPSSWKTSEAPYHAEKSLVDACRQDDAVLFDCVTVYLSNLLCQKSEAELCNEKCLYEEVGLTLQSLIAPVKAGRAKVIFVTNEVGAGIVPENHLARVYRDLAGYANQLLAEASDEVYALICGIPVQLK